MATQRPLKEGSVRTYQEKVGLGFPDILASEMDADLDTIYAAWNGNVGTANLIDGSVTTPKLATAPNGVATGNLNDLAVTTAKLADGSVTWPKHADLVGTRAYRSAALAIPSGAWTTVTWENVTGGTVGGVWNAGQPDRLTIQQAGWYAFGATVAFANAAGGTLRRLSLQITGPTYLAILDGRPGYATLSAATLANLAVSNIVYVQVFHDVGSAINVGSDPTGMYSSLWITRVA